LEGQNTFLGGHDFCFYYIFKTNFSENKKFGGAQKKFGRALPPNAPRGYGPALASTYQKVVVSKISRNVGLR